MTQPTPNTHVVRGSPRTALLAALLPALLGMPPGGGPATAAPTDGGPYRIQMIYRTTAKTNAPFDVDIIASTNNSLGMWYFTEIVRHGTRWRDPFVNGGGYADGSGTPYPSVYGIPGAPGLPTCPDMPGCSYPVAFDASRGYTVTPASTSRFYVVSAHADVRVELDTRGWAVRDVRDVRARRLFAAQASASGAGTTGTYVEHFTSASAPGGRYGSVVFAQIPCDGGGVGSARLTGKGADDGSGEPQPEPLVCTSSGILAYTFAYSPVQAVWRLDGDVTGIGYDTTRLFVLDLPKP